MINQKHYIEFAERGITVVPAAISTDLADELRRELEIAVAQDLLHRPDVFDKGMVHNCMVRGKRMAELLDNSIMNEFLAKAFSPTCVIYAYQSSSLPPSEGNYGSRIHVDSPRFIQGYCTNAGVIFPLNDFTEENGATYYLPGSHNKESLPDEENFYKNALRAVCKKGDMIVFNARVVHAAGLNKTTSTRHALTINICRSFMKQRFDFPRLVPSHIIERMGADGKRLLGMNVRVPTSLEEFYLPPEERLYQPNQG